LLQTRRRLAEVDTIVIAHRPLLCFHGNGRFGDKLYLAKKGVGSFGDLRIRDEKLVIPLRDIEGTLHSLQFIDATGEKRFLRSGRVAGCFFRIEGDPAQPTVIVEGVATGISVHMATKATTICAMNSRNLPAVAKAISQKNPQTDLIIAGDNDSQVPGNPGVQKATEAASAVGARLAIATPATGTDFNDLHQSQGIRAVADAVGAAQSVKEADQQVIARLAAMSPVDYDRARQAAADGLGIRVSVLDAEVAKVRPKHEETAPKLKCINLTPYACAVPVDGGQLLEDLRAVLRRYLSLPEDAVVAMALWVLHTWVYKVFDYTPILAVLSPQKRCGKSVTLELLHALSRDGLFSANATAAALYRIIELCQPTLFIDEFDSVGEQKREDLRNILNNGFHKTGNVLRCAGDNHDPVEFGTFCPKAVASIRSLPETAMDRSIVIHMKRKLRNEARQRLRKYDGTPLRARMLRWAMDNEARLADITAEPPDALNDRAQDIWEPLLIIARSASGADYELATKAALALSGDDSAESIGTVLLSDILIIFQHEGADQLSSAELLEALNAIEDRPWATWARGRPLHPHGLAKLLRSYGIASKNFKTKDGSVAKGYHKDHFSDAWDRYLPPEPAKTERYHATSPANKGDSAASRSATTETGSGSQNATKSNNDGAGSGVAEQELGPSPKPNKNADYF
jgi:putative DNA primase/helicase